VISYGMDYPGTPIGEGLSAKEGMEQPVTYWLPSIAPCGSNFYTGNLFPKWKNHLFVASLAAKELRRLEIKGNKLIAQEVIFKGETDANRIRDVIGGPDGSLYVLFRERIARLTPAK
jgi:aldose sugar dehydrogenase